MLRISKLTDYATMIMCYLAFDPTNILSATRLAKELHLTGPTVSKILKMLAEGGLVKSFRGGVGGYQLTRPSTEITLADIVSAIEGKLAMTECCDSVNLCALDSLCSLKENWQIINKVILDSLRQITLIEMTGSLKHHPLTLKGIRIKVE